MSCTITWWLTSGLPRQFCVMKANRRCSILFHLLVPGRQVRHGYLQAGLVGEALELAFP